MPLITVVALVVFIESTLHYFPWRKVLQGHELPRMVAYALGVMGMMVPFSIWLIENDQWETFKVLWDVILAAGLSVLICYAIDWVIELVWKLREAGQREKAAMTGFREIIDGKSKSTHD
jgi:L-lactate permease